MLLCYNDDILLALEIAREALLRYIDTDDFPTEAYKIVATTCNEYNQEEE